MNIDQPSVIIDDEPMCEREDRPRSRTWPILPPPIETIHEHERDAEIAEPPPIIEEVEPEEEENEAQRTETNHRKNSRKNAWGNLSYADLITQAIQSSPEQRLTLSQIYEWMVRNIPYFKDKGDSTSSAGWKNSIRHNLSLHSRFMRVQNDNNGKSSYWVINPDAKPGKSSRRRSGSVDGQPKGEKKRVRNKKLHQSTDDISSLSPNGVRMNLNINHNRSYDNLFAPSPCSSTDSLSNVDDIHGNELPYTYAGESFARPRSTSNVSTQSSINGRTTPPHIELDDMINGYEDTQIGSSGVADDIESMSIENHCTVASTINLSDSVKLPPRRPHSDSFGSGDSGYDSPAFPSPIQQGQVPPNLQNRQQINKLSSTSLVPNKPPPPYSTPYHNQMRPQPYVNYFPQQNQQRMNVIKNQAPRLKHLPIPHQGSFGVPNQTLSNYVHQRLPNTRTFPGALQNSLRGNMFDNYLLNCNSIVPNITVDNKMMPSQQQHLGKGQFLNNDDIPMDLYQVPLFGFDDQQQLASDLDAIISNEMEASSLKSICEPYLNDTNNNHNTNTTNINMFTPQQISGFPGQHWVR